VCFVKREIFGQKDSLGGDLEQKESKEDKTWGMVFSIVIDLKMD
jgi:hypothetical protein